MKLRSFTMLSAAWLVIGGVSAFGQQTGPKVFTYQGLLDRMPVLPAVPPMPAMPAMSFLREFPGLENFEFSFGGQSSANSSSTDPAIAFQQGVFRTLLRNNPDRALEVAADRLKSDPSDPVVLGNMGTIANSESPKALPLLITIAKKSTNPKARTEAAMAIARSRNEKDGVGTMEDLYNSGSDSAELRRAIVSSMSRMSDPKAVPVLARIAKSDSDDSVRHSAVQALGMRKEPEALKALEDLLKSKK